MERKTFVLTHTKEFRRHITLFIKDSDGKFDKRSITFTTEHKVSEKDRSKRARKIAAEFSTADEKIYDALLRDTSYGKTFVLKGDDKGELKREPFDITPVDAKKVALKNLFKAADLEFDNSKSTDVLEAEYQVFMNAKTGSEVTTSGPAKIEHKPVDPLKEIQDKIDASKAAYKEKYGEDVPAEFANDKAFLSAISDDPNFDAKAYIEKNSPAFEEEAKEESLEDVQQEYFDVLGVNAPNNKKTDIHWMKGKIAAKKAE